MTPLLRAYSMAVAATWDSPGPPSDMLITSAPWSVAHTMPSATSTHAQESASQTVTGRMRRLSTVAAMPTPLFVSAVISPETNVPW